MTTVKKISQHGLLAAAIMLPLILIFYSLADAAPQVVNIGCGEDIDAKINADPRGTASRFVLEANCPPVTGDGPAPFIASATIVPSNGDVVACEVPPTFVQVGERAYDPTTRCTVEGNASVENVFRPIGKGGTTATVRFEGIKITGGNFTGSTGTGAAIAEGSMTNLSTHYGIEVMDNDATGVLSGKGTFERVEFTNNTLDSRALGVIGASLKARDEVEVKNSYIHNTQGNGLWCDNFCHDSARYMNEECQTGCFWVHDNLVVNNGRAGIRFERVGDVSTAGEALIENNEVYANSLDEKRSGVSVRDAQNATIRNNVFDNNARNVAIIASDSGRSDRPNLWNIDIMNNTLNGEIIKGCELPDTVVYCPGYP